MARSLFGICAVVVLVGASVCMAAEERSPKCIAKLPDGTTVELVGLRHRGAMLPSDFGDDRHQWWRPDGVALAESLDQGPVSYTSYSDAYAFVVRVGDRPECSCVAVGPWERDTDLSNLRSKHQPSSPSNDLRRFWLRFNRDQKIADMRLGVATGTWTVLQEWPAPGKYGRPDGLFYRSPEELVFRCPEQDRQNVVAEVVHGLIEEATRLVIFDQDNQPHIATSDAAGWGGGLTRYIYTFENLEVDNIRRIEFQKRPYDYWITFRNISLRPGQKTQVQAQVERKSTGLTGRPLPRFNVAHIDAAVEKAKGKRILLCFWDVGQRPSRNCFQQLAQERDALESKGISVIPVHISTPGDQPPQEWLEKNRIPLLTEILGDDRVQARQIWGVNVLPWLVLTDNNHNVTAEGFPLHELGQRLADMGEAKP